MNEPAQSGTLGRADYDVSAAGGETFALETIMSACFSIKDRHKTIGVAVRCVGGFRAFTSEFGYRKLEDRAFRNIRTINRLVAQLGGRS